MKHPKQAFTLIELLVVVLIIGILAAVALPQYKLAVTKARVATILPIMKSIADAEHSYYLANGHNTSDISLLDVDLPEDCSFLAEETEAGKLWKCGNSFLLRISPFTVAIYLEYCPNNNGTDFETCSNKRDFQIQKYFTNANYGNKDGRWGCSIKNSSPLGQKFCDTFISNK